MLSSEQRRRWRVRVRLPPLGLTRGGRGSDVDDLQRAWRALPNFTWKGGGVQPWLFRIAASELAGWYRRERKHVTPRAQLALREHADSRTADDTPAEVDEAVRAALWGLRPRYQQAVTLRYLTGLSAEEAAAAMGCSRPTFAVTLHRALRALRLALTEEATP